MPALTPNAPGSRLCYVIDTYAEKHPSATWAALVAGMQTVGMDHALTDIVGEFHGFVMFVDAVDPVTPINYDLANARKEYLRWVGNNLHPASSPQALADASRDPEFTSDTVRQSWEMMCEALRAAAPSHHQYDFIIPWMGRELARLSKYIKRRKDKLDFGSGYGEWNQLRHDFSQAAAALQHQGTAIAMWAKDNRIDLTKTTLADALDAAEEYERDVAEVPQGDVVYEYGDGWTMQRLAPEHLEIEGEVMQHCVGALGYARGVEEGKLVIFSLRDPKGHPHATIEWVPKGDAGPYANMDAIAEAGYVDINEREGRFEQIQGKQNQPPKPEYMERIRQFIADRFNGDPLAMLNAGALISEISWRNRDLREVAFSALKGPYERRHDTAFEFVDVSFVGTDFANAELEQTRFHNCDFSRCNMEDALFGGRGIVRCRFERTVLTSALFRDLIEKCQFVEAMMNRVDLAEVAFDECEFVRTPCTGADMVTVEFQGCNFEGSPLDGAHLHGVDFRDCAFEGPPLDDVTSPPFGHQDTEYTLSDVRFQGDLTPHQAGVTAAFIAAADESTGLDMPEQVRAQLEAHRYDADDETYAE